MLAKDQLVMVTSTVSSAQPLESHDICTVSFLIGSQEAASFLIKGQIVNTLGAYKPHTASGSHNLPAFLSLKM